jgi:hypothetical protein
MSGTIKLSGVVTNELSGLNWNYGGGSNETNRIVAGDSDYAI